jgi:hypothetical protein
LLAIGCAVSCCAYCTISLWRSHAELQTFEQAIDTLNQAASERATQSSITVLSTKMDEALRLLQGKKDEPGKIGEYARLALKKARESAH